MVLRGRMDRTDCRHGCERQPDGHRDALQILGGFKPSKANRLREIVAETVAIFREAVAANPACEVDPNPDVVPTTGFRHALNYVIFNLGMEMGFSSRQSLYANDAPRTYGCGWSSRERSIRWNWSGWMPRHLIRQG